MAETTLSAEEILLAASPEVQEVVKETLRRAGRESASGASITKDEVIAIIRGIVK